MTPRLQKLFDVLGRESLLPKERLNEVTVEVPAVDYLKTCRKLRDDPQLRIYHYALSRLYPGEKYIIMSIVFLRDGGAFSLDFGPADLPRTEAMLRERFEAVRDCQRPRRIIDDPGKRWKFRRDDLEVRRRFDEWIAAWDEALTETSTDWAPWYVVPADRNWVKALAVAELVADALERLDPQLPDPEEGIEGIRIE